MSLIAPAGIYAASAAGAQPYQPSSVFFNGGVYAERDAGLTGIADAPRFLFSGLFRRTGGDGTARRLFTGHATFNSRFIVHLVSDNTLRIEGRNSSNATIFEVIGPVVTDSDIHHVACSVDLTTAGTTDDRSFRFDGSDPSPTWAAFTNDAIDFAMSSPEWVVGGYQPSGPTQRWIGDMAEIQFWTPASYVDLATDLGNFISGGKPVNPATAASAYGTPIVLLSGGTSGFLTNQGSGGGFTLKAGSLAAGQEPVML